MRKENILPYQWKGRWYRLQVSSDQKTLTIQKDEIKGVKLSGTNLEMPMGFHVIDAKLDITSVPDGTTNVPGGIKVFKSGAQGVELPNKDSLEAVTVYVFGYQE